MSTNRFNEQIFQEMPIIGILRNISLEDISHILPHYLASGLTTLEITMNSPAAEDSIRFAVEKYAGKLNIGAGTVCDMHELELALSAGAQFIVTPIINEDVIKECVKRKIPIFPGAYTATEIYNAWKLGASRIKVFPATSLGPNHFKDLKGPFPNIKLVATGGISLDNLVAFLEAGISGFGIGSTLFNKAYIKEKKWAELFEVFCRYQQLVKNYFEKNKNGN
ncbi:2-dehydro-3-deoxy-6-phosphogalactonate aldolase [compost metagenome]